MVTSDSYTLALGTLEDCINESVCEVRRACNSHWSLAKGILTLTEDELADIYYSATEMAHDHPVSDWHICEATREYLKLRRSYR